MVAKFDTNPSIRRTLNYNENKVKQQVAELLTAENYPIDAELLTFQQKLARLENQAALNQNVTRNSVHISLNFDPSERLEKDVLIGIAKTYMDKIGFGEQPFLVYRHHDAGHPHIHIVSIKIKEDGKRIDTQNIGRNQSEKARKEIEIDFGLVKAEDSKKTEAYQLEPVNAQKAQYGKMETKRAINNVLKTILDAYRYTSLPELNAVLKLYNVAADKGSERSNMFRNHGLTYRVLDASGNKVGTPVKASQFFMRPTLTNLEGKFQRNEPLKKPFSSRIKNAIDLALLKDPGQSLTSLLKVLEKDGIATVIRQNEEGRIYGITYIDHKNKVVFNGSDLGKNYSAKAILKRCNADEKGQYRTQQDQNKAITDPLDRTRSVGSLNPMTGSLADALLAQDAPSEAMPFELRSKRKKRKHHSNNQ
jgi:hypothetical protein